MRWLRLPEPLRRLSNNLRPYATFASLANLAWLWWSTGIGAVVWLWAVMTEVSPVWAIVAALVAFAGVAFGLNQVSRLLVISRSAPQMQNIATRPSTSASVGPFPDIKIRALFVYIETETAFLDQYDAATRAAPYEVIGDDVHDKMSVGRLLVWGRGYPRQFGTMFKSPIERIEASEMTAAKFTYNFLPEPGENTKSQPDTYRGRYQNGSEQDREYHDLQVNRAQAETIWPKKLAV